MNETVGGPATGKARLTEDQPGAAGPHGPEQVDAGASELARKLRRAERQFEEANRRIETLKEELVASQAKGAAAAERNKDLRARLGRQVQKLGRAQCGEAGANRSAPWGLAQLRRFIDAACEIGNGHRQGARHRKEARCERDCFKPAPKAAPCGAGRRRSYRPRGSALGRPCAESGIAASARRSPGTPGDGRLHHGRIHLPFVRLGGRIFARSPRRTGKSQLAETRPDLLLVKSAWRGHDESWGAKVGHNSDELKDILTWCREADVPTVFWNKEDPVHFATFINAARAFDYVFTTDLDCIHRYKAALGHGRVYLLPFASQPRTINPAEIRDRKDAYSFAGAYYVKYPERTRDLDTLLDTLSNLRPVEIFDRNAGQNDPDFQFPEKYRPYIVGTLPFEKIDRAYKGYRFGINLNSIKQSQTMFARRVPELLASNTLAVSNYSRAVRMMFGDLVVATDNAAELETRLRRLLDDPDYADRIRRGDVPPGDGGQRAVDRPATPRGVRRSARTARRSAWSTCCCSRSRGRRRSSRRWGSGRGAHRSACDRTRQGDRASAAHVPLRRSDVLVAGEVAGAGSDAPG